MFEAGPVLLALGEAMCAPPVCRAAGVALAGLALAHTSPADTLLSTTLMADTSLAAVLAAISTAWNTLTVSIGQAHAHAPALVLGLAALFTIPPLALVGHLLSRRRAAAEQARRLARLAPITESDEIAAEGAPTTAAVPGDAATGPRTVRGDGMTWPVDAWLKLEGDRAASIPIAREIIRIGREDDNDIVLPLSTVHRYHAVVQRTDEAEIVVLDISGEDGNGVLVNGKRVSRQRLRDGDKIGIGHAALTFQARRI